MKVGFTGTRTELTCEQYKALCELVKALDPALSEWHHGCCIGADMESVEIIEAWKHGVALVAHPPDKNALVSPSALHDSSRRELPLPYLERNKAIVDACDFLIACPKEMAEERRSGTWSTVRYARRQGKRIIIVWPDGSRTEEGAA